jgi:hypothetical protein
MQIYHAIPLNALKVMAIGRVVAKPPVNPFLDTGIAKFES